MRLTSDPRECVSNRFLLDLQPFETLSEGVRGCLWIVLLVVFSFLVTLKATAEPQPTAPPPEARLPYRILFNSYDGDPVKGKLEEMTFQINTVDLRRPTEFLKLGEIVRNTRLKLTKFEYKVEKMDDGELKDVSELAVTNVVTQETAVLTFGVRRDVAAIAGIQQGAK